VHPYEHRAEKRSRKLRDRVGKDFAEVARQEREADRHRWIDVRVRTSTRHRSEYAGEHRKRPSCGDREPSGILTL
jgi:hypothetical protein